MVDTLSGQELGGYIIGPLIGGGGMGEVYQAFAPDRTTVAVKVLRSEYAFEPDLQARFVREIRLLQSAQHDNIIPILDAGSNEGLLFLVMKLVNGTTLARMFARRRFTPLETWQILKPVTKALAYVHSQGIVHRDVKPGNIFLERQGEGWHIYLGDFGLGKNLTSDYNLTAAGSAVGTSEYMSVEAALGGEIDERTDIYSLAVVAYEMLLGRLPLNLPSNRQVTPAVLMRAIPLPTQLRPDFPPKLESVLLKGLVKKREDRYQTVQDFASDLHQALAHLSEEQLNTEYWVDD